MLSQLSTSIGTKYSKTCLLFLAVDIIFKFFVLIFVSWSSILFVDLSLFIIKSTQRIDFQKHLGGLLRCLFVLE